MLIRNKENRNIAVSKGHQYTVEKVKKAMEFINHTGRNTTVEQWVEMYNYLKNADDSIKGCKSCAAAKYTASVRNYARFGYLTLLNEGHNPEEFGIGEKKKEEPVENVENRIDLGKKEEEIIENVKEALEEEPKVEEPKEDAVIEDVKEALQEEEVQEEPVEEEKQEEIAQDKPKRGRKSSKK